MSWIRNRPTGCSRCWPEAAQRHWLLPVTSPPECIDISDDPSISLFCCICPETRSQTSVSCSLSSSSTSLPEVFAPPRQRLSSENAGVRGSSPWRGEPPDRGIGQVVVFPAGSSPRLRIFSLLFLLRVRSLAAESSRAFQGGPLEPTYYEDASVRFLGEGKKLLIDDSNEFSFSFPNLYTHKLDWFAVDLQEEHSAMDSQILEDHTDYVVYAINRSSQRGREVVVTARATVTEITEILEQYKESKEALLKEGAEIGSLPASVILVGHSMGGFVARAAVVHPLLRKSSVETVLTLASPHQSPPVALQPSLGHLFSLVNSAWREGYEIQTTHTGRFLSSSKLSNVVVISIAGGVNDYQVRTKVASLEGIVPETNGFMISSSSVKNVWLSMDHQSILWCNQLVVQISHTLLTMINVETGQPFPSTQKRLSIFSRMLQSGVSQSFNWKGHVEAAPLLTHVPFKESQDYAGIILSLLTHVLLKDVTLILVYILVLLSL
ncbi:hypothetical protein Taro_013363 [Colocasia esculenta]|uniref:GPI inositol-deacylase n=1 Tax=Colocasia esculenta TaxID=4460 RepID=A0A843UG95_COLES|nr:hypothetical protein [Colocasia esculenta]